MISAIILAGGKSERCRQNKMLLDFFDVSLIKETIESVKPFANKLIIVTGHFHNELKKELKGYNLSFNPYYETGMFSSILCGVKEVEGNFFVLPGDCPFVKKSTFEEILKGDGLIRVPTYNDKNGHPIYFDASLKEKILTLDKSDNLKAFRDSVGYSKIAVNDKNILNDIDTLNDYQKLLDERKNNER